jgi:predicted ABC-type ATPase
VREQAQRECEEFVAAQIEGQSSFAVETTLRSVAAIVQAVQAKAVGFLTQMVYVATNDVEVNVERVARRALNGGHAAPPERIREIYEASLGNLRAAIDTFDRVLIYDNSVDTRRPTYVCEFRQGRLVDPHIDLPDWLQRAALR